MSASSSAEVSAGGMVAGPLMVAIGLYTPLHAAAVALLLAAPWVLGAGGWTVVAGLTLLYAFPPLAARLVLMACDRPTTTVPVGSAAFLRWWALAQLQLVFTRLPALEELLRLVPSLYSAWLRLWGARVGRFVYWAPGVLVTDRSLLEVGDRVVVGVSTRIVAHLIIGHPDGRRELLMAPVVIGSGTIVGGFSLLGPGARIVEGETPPAFTVLSPFWTWSGGRRRFAPGHAATARSVAGGDGG